MADGTKIEWTDATWNPITGCSVKSAGCKHCYAMKLAGTRMKHHWSRKGLTVDTKAGPVWTGEVRFNEEWLDQPLRWKAPREIFVCAHADLFHEDVPDAWIDRIFAVMAMASQHRFQVLTKRSARMRAYFADPATERRVWKGAVALDAPPAARARYAAAWGTKTSWPLRNVWLGVSVEHQAAADERLRHLLATPAAGRWLSCEPLLGPLTFQGRFVAPGIHVNWLEALDQVIVGGESGPGARPMHPDWVRALRDECAACGTPFFFKHWGEWAPIDEGNLPEGWGAECDAFRVCCSNGFVGPLALESAFLHKPAHYPSCFPSGPDGDCVCQIQTMKRVGKKAAGRLLDDVRHDGRPA